MTNIMKILYETKYQMLFEKGMAYGMVTPFESEVFKKLEGKTYSSIPADIHIKYLNSTNGVGNCFERSYILTMAFNECLLVEGNTTYLSKLYGEENSRHSWVEVGDYVYDPSMMLRVRKDLYYEANKPYNVTKKYRAELERSKQYMDSLNGVVDINSANAMMPLLEDAISKSNDCELLSKVNVLKQKINYNNCNDEKVLVKNK